MELEKDKYIKLINLVEKIKNGNGAANFTLDTDPEIAGLANSIMELGRILEKRFLEMKKILAITQQINRGILFEEVINYLYDNFYDLIPYDRIGVSIINEDKKTVRALWAKSRADTIYIEKGYELKIEDTSLKNIINSNEPRIINDLEEYYKEHPDSRSTHLVLKEGVRSSLTCPLIVSTKAVGFIFFSSFKKFTYSNVHVSLFIEIAENISIIIEKSKLYTEILEQKKNLEELNALKNRFLGIAAHDLRNPLSVILNYSEYLSDSIDTISQDEIKSGLEEIKNSSKEMFTLVNDLLDVSKIESGTLELDLSDFDFIAYIKNLVEKNRMLAKPKNINVELILPETSFTASYDKNKITQIINNLITNAVKFSLPGKDVTIAISYLNNYMNIEVIDNGPGIEEKDLENLFQGFYRGKNRPTAGEKSTGLGLAICKKLVEAHNGSITVKSKVGEGSNFIISLPINFKNNRIISEKV